MTAAKIILVVDDDPHLRESVGFSLERAGYTVKTAGDGAAGLELFQEARPALIILDIIMPKMDGTELCREIRKSSNVPIIFLTSVSDEVDRIVGLELGGDDYVTKPFSPRELVARVKAILRRVDNGNATNKSTENDAEAGNEEAISHGSIKVDFESHKIFCADREITLTALEFRLLAALIRRPKKVFDRDSIMTHAYPGNTYVSDRTIDSHIRKIRQKFADTGIDPIETVHGVGYKISPAVQD